MDSQESQEKTQQPRKKFIYQSDFMSLSKFFHLLSKIRSSKPRNVKAKITSSNSEIIKQIKKALKNNYSNAQSEKQKTILYSRLQKSQMTDQQVRQNCQYRKTIEFFSHPYAVMYRNKYCEKLLSLEKEYNLHLIFGFSSMQICSYVPTTPVLESQMIDMRKKLNYVCVKSMQMAQKVLTSKVLQQELKKNEIFFHICGKNIKCYFYSTIFEKQAILQNVKRILSGEVKIIKFQNRILSMSVNRSYFRMICHFFEPFLKNVEQIYQIKCEIHYRRLSAIMHIKNKIFSKQPIQKIVRFFQNICFIAYHTDSPSEHFSHILKNKPKRYMQSSITTNFVYTCWNRNDKIQPQEVEKVFQKFLQELHRYSQVRIGFSADGLNYESISKIQALANKHKLDCEYPAEDPQKQYRVDILHVRFRFYDENRKAKKVEQFRQFLVELIIGSDEYVIDPSKDISNIKYSDQSSNDDQQQILQSGDIKHEKKIKKIENNDIKVENMQKNELSIAEKPKQQVKQFQPRIIGIHHIFEKPSQINSIFPNLKPIEKRNKPIEKKIEQQFGIICKVWNVIIESPVQQYPQNSQPSQCLLFPAEEPKFDETYRIRQPQKLSFRNLRSNTKYSLVSEIQKSGANVVTHQMIVYNAQ